jgi:hypothetical protein
MDESTLSNDADIQSAIDITLTKTNIIMDATLLTSIMSCPRLSDFRFNHNLVSIGGKSNSLECGSIVHKFLEVYNGSMIKGIKRDEALGFGLAAAELYIQGCKYCTGFTGLVCDDCSGIGVVNSFADEVTNCLKCNGTGKILKPSCGHEVNGYPGVTNTPKDSDGHKIGWSWVLDTCNQYHEYYRNDFWVPLEVEVVKGEILYEDDEIRVMWKAKLDRIVDTNEGIYPVDAKTMKQRRDTLSLNNQFIGQCLLMKTRRVFIDKIGFQTTLKPAEKFLRPPMTYSAARLMEWQSETLPYYAKLLLMYAEGGHYPPNYTHCENKYGNCAFVKVCEADPMMREEELKLGFIVGEKWNPVSSDEGVD